MTDSWHEKKLSEVCSKVSKTKPEDLGRSTFSYIDIGSIDSVRHQVATPQVLPVGSAPSRARQLVAVGDTVFSTVRPYLLNIAWVGEELDGEIASTGFCVLRAETSQLLPKFLHLFCCSDLLLDQVLPLQRGVSYPAVRDSDVLSAAVPIPSLAEQQCIVEILEEQFSRLDAALTSIRTVREKAAAFRRSLLHAAFSGTFSAQPIGEWRVEALSNIAELSLGVMLDRAKDTGESQFRYLANINVRWGSFETGHLKTMQVLPKQIDRATIRCGDLVVCEGGEPGRCAIWGGESGIAIQKALHRVRPTADVISSYLYHYFEFRFRGVQSDELFTGTTIRHLPKEKLATLKIPLPSLAEQQRVVDILQEQLSRFDAAINIANQLEARINFEGRSLLHSAFEGTLTAQWRETHHG